MVHLEWDLARHRNSNSARLFILSVWTTQLGVFGLPTLAFALIRPPVTTFLSSPMSNRSWEMQVLTNVSAVMCLGNYMNK